MAIIDLDNCREVNNNEWPSLTLVHDPPLILADEPTAHLDHIQVEGVLMLLRSLAAPGRIVVVATHDDRISQLADRVIELAPHSPEVDLPSEKVRIGSGDILFEQGDPSDFIYEVDSGRLEAYRVRADGGHEPVATVGPHQYVGELGPILNFPRSATVRALEDSVVTPLSVRPSGSGPFVFRKMHRRQLNDSKGPGPGPGHCGDSPP